MARVKSWWMVPGRITDQESWGHHSLKTASLLLKAMLWRFGCWSKACWEDNLLALNERVQWVVEGLLLICET